MLRTWFEGVVAGWMAGVIARLMEQPGTYRTALDLGPERIRSIVRQDASRFLKKGIEGVGFGACGVVLGCHAFLLTIGLLTMVEPVGIAVVDGWEGWEGPRLAWLSRMRPPRALSPVGPSLSQQSVPTATIRPVMPSVVRTVRSRWVCVMLAPPVRPSRSRVRRQPTVDPHMQLRLPRPTCITWVDESVLFPAFSGQRIDLEWMDVPYLGSVTLLPERDIAAGLGPSQPPEGGGEG